MHANKKISNNHEHTTIVERAKLAKMLLRLFDLWQIDTSSQLTLLGLSVTSRAMLTRYRQGTTPLPDTQDILDRAGWLLAIHKALRSLYAKNPDLCYQWICLPNAGFANEIPLNYMKKYGLIGMAKVARFLQLQLVM